MVVSGGFKGALRGYATPLGLRKGHFYRKRGKIFFFFWGGGEIWFGSS